MATDAALLPAFLRGEVDIRMFGHVDHLHVAYELLAAHEFPTACALFSSALKVIAGRAGHPEAYHETITIAFLALIGERRAAAPDAGFQVFLEAHPELLDKALLQRWYEPERLGSPIARATFVLPRTAR